MSTGDLMLAIRRRMARNVREHGWGVVAVGAEGGVEPVPSFAYTVGLTETFAHPEFMLMGFDPNLSMGVLNAAGQRVKTGIRFTDRSMDDKVIDRFPVWFRSVPMPEGRRWARLAAERCQSRPLELLQMFLPDQLGRFPWDADCSASFVLLQGRLLESMTKPH